MNERRMILGIGTGRCGTRSLSTLLSRQPNTRVTHEERPLLSWRTVRPSEMAQRMGRMIRRRKEAIIGDVASFYLPYAEQAIAFAPDVRIACLKRPREDVVQSFCRWLDKVHPLPTNHWARRPAPGWHHEAVWTRIFPQYDIQDRAEGIRRYWDEYYQQAEALAARFPQNLRIFDWQDIFHTETRQRELLSFCGFRSSEQVVALDIHENQSEEAVEWQAPAPRGTDPDDPRRCVVLVPVSGRIVQRCENALQELERRGYSVRRVSDYVTNDQRRNQMLTAALIAGFEETFWIDSDVVFDPDDVERLRAHHLPFVCAICPNKGKQKLMAQDQPGPLQLTIGKQAGLTELQYAAAGFWLVRREVYERVQWELDLPLCNQQSKNPLLPFFQPMVLEEESGPSYLPEDWSFCERTRQCGFRIMVDMSIRLRHEAAGASQKSDVGKEQAVSRPQGAGVGSQGSGAKRQEPEAMSLAAVANAALPLPPPPTHPSPLTSVAPPAFAPCASNLCAILVPVADRVEPACESSLRELERRGYRVWRVHGYKQIDLGRCQMASDALAAGCEETLWIDADTGFHPDMVDRLRANDLPIVCGIYPKKSKRELAIHALPGTKEIIFGKGGGLLEILYAPTGFLLVRREVYSKLREQLELPECRADTGRTLVPYYAPLIRPDGEGWWYLADDFAFCERARMCGYKIIADTTIRLLHIGTYTYGWEDAGRRIPRFASYKFQLSDATPKEGK